MKFFSWFTPKNKRNIVLPSPEKGPLQGVELIKAFTVEDEPKLKDFPKDLYKIYWEIFIEAIPGGYGALVRFYSYDTGLVSEHLVNKQNVADLRAEVSALILQTMEQNKRV